MVEIIFHLTDMECFARKGLGRVRFLYPLASDQNITIDVFNIHTQSDESFTGQESKRRVRQLNQVMPYVENSNADLVLLGNISAYSVKNSSPNLVVHSYTVFQQNAAQMLINFFRRRF